MRPNRPTPAPTLADDFVEHLPALHAAAAFFVNEPALAEQAVIRALHLVCDGPHQPAEPLHDRLATLFAAVDQSCNEILATTDPNFPAPPTPNALPHPERAALAMVAFGGQSYRTTAAALGVAPCELASQLTSGLRRLMGHWPSNAPTHQVGRVSAKDVLFSPHLVSEHDG